SPRAADPEPQTPNRKPQTSSGPTRNPDLPFTMRNPSPPAPLRREARRAAPAGDWPLPLAGPSAAAAPARAAFAAALRVATPVLIAADAGLDADAVARAIHDRSRPGTPFVVLDCGASDAATLERELFGVSPRDGGRADVEHVALSSVVLR